MLEEIDEAALLMAAQTAGELPPSSDQLKRWRRAGLIPRPRIVRAPGVRGTQARYPAWAADQLAALLRLHRSTHRLPDLCLALWWEGHWVDSNALRDALAAPLERIAQKANKASAGASDPYEAADRILAAIQREGWSTGVTGSFSKQLSSPADLKDVAWTLLVMAMGGAAPWEEEDRSRPDPAPGALQLLGTALGVDQAMSEDLTGNGPWLPADFDLRKLLTDLRDAGGFDLTDPAHPVREATDTELMRAREDALMFCQQLAMILSTLQGILGREVPALSGLSAMVTTTSTDRAAMVRMMLILRSCVGDETFSAVSQLVEQVHERFAAIARLRAGLPQHESILRLDIAERLAALPATRAAQAREDVARFLDQHPQVARALANDDANA